MKTFSCTCGQPVFFDNTVCHNCSRRLGFDWDTLELLSLGPVEDANWMSADGRVFRRCGNDIEYGNCNGLLAVSASRGRCVSCALNKVIPALDREGNLALWTRVEAAKRRLVYSLLAHDLPLDDGQGHALAFRIMEDQQRNPDVTESFVPIAHQGGTITLNIAEADPVQRQAMRERMHERYRTLLGHLRHEAGHFYYLVLVSGKACQDAFRSLFGDESMDYDVAMKRYYDAGPSPDWSVRHISAYASSHPHEDFAETFAHYLHIRDALESAAGTGLAYDPAADGDNWLGAWLRLSISLNEIGRSLGWDDPYPFVLTGAVRDKLDFIDRLVRPDV